MTSPDPSLAENFLIDLNWWGIVLLAAPFVGSFLGVLITRHDAPLSIVTGRSACPACGARLGFADLIPLVSWMLARGRCRHCGQPIGLFHPAIEAAALGVALWVVLAADPAMRWIDCLLGWTLLALAATDLDYFTLPDFLTWPLAAAGLAAAWSIDRAGFGDHLAGAMVGLAFIIALHYAYRWLRGRDGIGLGDAKLFGAAGAWVGWIGLPSVMLVASLSALVFAVARRRSGDGLSGSDRVPLGAFLGLGLWIVWLYGPLGIGWQD
jgi:leader peptidase (prepilin peptidase)/N-methyltransferase